MSKDFQKRRIFNPQFMFHERRRSYRLALILFGSIIGTILVQHYVISLGIIREHSMSPTLQDGNLFLVNKYAYLLHPPERGDIVVLRTAKYAEEQFVKRVIALEGDRLRIQGGVVFLNGKRLKEPYINGRTFPDFGPHIVPEGTCFVMGDNRMHSIDSREFGSIPITHLEGKIRPGAWFSWD